MQPCFISRGQPESRAAILQMVLHQIYSKVCVIFTATISLHKIHHSPLASFAYIFSSLDYFVLMYFPTTSRPCECLHRVRMMMIISRDLMLERILQLLCIFAPLISIIFLFMRCLQSNVWSFFNSVFLSLEIIRTCMWYKKLKSPTNTKILLVNPFQKRLKRLKNKPQDFFFQI